jgi:hypothetical protein
MVLILLSIIFAATAVAIPRIRHRIAFLSLTLSGGAREDSALPKERTEQSTFAGPMRQFLIVVLPDGKMVNPMVADRF